MKWFFLTLGALGILAPAATVWANGRFPSAGHIEVDPENPERILLRATYGLVVTHDGGKRWDWLCEKAMNYGGVWDPPVGVMKGGSILLGLPDGLSISTPDACRFSRAMALEGKLVTDVAVDKKNPSRAVVLTSSPLGMAFDTRLFLTEDSGATFVQVGDVFPENLHGLTVDLCASDPNVLYVSGVLVGAMPRGIVLRSSNGGSTYETAIVPDSDIMHGPFIGAVDPENADRLYVRLEGIPGRLFVSEDGSKSWTELFWGEGSLLGFSLSPDGKTLVVGGEKDGVWRSPAPNWAFERTSALHARCLRWTNAGIYACAEQGLDGFSVGLSVTNGSTFKPLEKLSDLCGPVSCVMPICSSDWPTLRDTLGATSCDVDTSSSSTGAGGAGGNGGQTFEGVGGCACHVERRDVDGKSWFFLACCGFSWRRRSRGCSRAYLTRRNPIS